MRYSLPILMLVLAAPAFAGGNDRHGETINLNVNGMPPASALEGDPDVTVCVRQTAIGSRLGAGRVCKTRSGWQAQRLASRDDLVNGQIRQTNPHESAGDTGFFQSCTALHGC